MKARHEPLDEKLPHSVASGGICVSHEETHEELGFFSGGHTSVAERLLVTVAGRAWWRSAGGGSAGGVPTEEEGGTDVEVAAAPTVGDTGPVSGTVLKLLFALLLDVVAVPLRNFVLYL